MSTANPLLHIQIPIPFDQIRAEHVEPAIDALLADAQAQLDDVAADATPRSYDNTLGAMERATETLEYAMGVVGHLESVATTPELRAVYNRVQPRVSAFYAAIPLHKGLFRALCALSDSLVSATLTRTQGRLLKKTLADFRRHGALLDEAGQVRLRALDVELSQVTTRFSQQLLDATNAFSLHISEDEAGRLSGLPESALHLAREAAAQRGLAGYRLTLHQPSLLPALTYLHDGALREALWRASNTRAIHKSGAEAALAVDQGAASEGGASAEAPSDNPALIRRIVALRAEKARLLGFRDFADLILEDRMAQSGAEALRFITDLRSRTEAAFAREAAELLAFRRQLEGPEAPPLMPWDLAYYAEKQRQARYDFDDEALRPYLPAEQVLAGLFDLAQRLYGVRITPTALPTWDPAVTCYQVREGEEGPLLASFYVDLHPRENKRGGAWMNALVTGTPGGLSGAQHVGLFCANVQPPLPSQGLPSLLTHDEADTLFHEFGHLLHHALTRVPVRSLAGTNVPWDFVELPSQFMENFCWERAALDQFARHHQSGAPIPEELLSRMLRARTYRAATAQMRQLGFAAVDLLLHTSYTPERDGDVMAYARRVLSEYTPAPLPEDYGMLAGFNHLFGSAVGYAAGYYSYKWAEVLDADAFGRFLEEGLFNPAVGQAFRREILEVGDSRDPMESFQAFRGRPPALDALLQRTGLTAA